MDLRKHVKIIDLEAESTDVNQVQKSLFERAVDNSTYLPRGLNVEDLDRGFLDYVRTELEFVVQGKKVPVELFSLQKFSEHMKTWTQTDKTKTVQLPFVAIVRKPLPKRGTNFGNINFNIPDDGRYTLYRVPNEKNGRKTYELYQIPQPVNVDIEYELNFFAVHQRVANRMAQKMLKEFQSSQRYIDIYGHFMNLQWKDVSDSSQLSDLSKRRYYHFKYEMILKGYILEKEDFRIVKVLDNINFKTQLSTVKESRECKVEVEETGDCDICYIFKFTRKSPSSTEAKIAYDMEFTFDNQSVPEYDLLLNGQAVTLPFTANKGDTLRITNNKTGITKPLNIKICGKAS
jgi:hypothetical protein